MPRDGLEERSWEPEPRKRSEIDLSGDPHWAMINNPVWEPGMTTAQFEQKIADTIKEVKVGITTEGLYEVFEAIDLGVVITRSSCRNPKGHKNRRFEAMQLLNTGELFIMTLSLEGVVNCAVDDGRVNLFATSCPEKLSSWLDENLA